MHIFTIYCKKHSWDLSGIYSLKWTFQDSITFDPHNDSSHCGNRSPERKVIDVRSQTELATTGILQSGLPTSLHCVISLSHRTQIRLHVASHVLELGPRRQSVQRSDVSREWDEAGGWGTWPERRSNSRSEALTRLLVRALWTHEPRVSKFLIFKESRKLHLRVKLSYFEWLKPMIFYFLQCTPEAKLNCIKLAKLKKHLCKLKLPCWLHFKNSLLERMLTKSLWLQTTQS